MTDCQCNDTTPTITINDDGTGPSLMYHDPVVGRDVPFTDHLIDELTSDSAECKVTNNSEYSVSFSMETSLRTGNLKLKTEIVWPFTIGNTSLSIRGSTGQSAVVLSWDGSVLTGPNGRISDGDYIECSYVEIVNTCTDAALEINATPIISPSAVLNFELYRPTSPTSIDFTVKVTELGGGRSDPTFTIKSAPPGGCDCGTSKNNNDVSRRSA